MSEFDRYQDEQYRRSKSDREVASAGSGCLMGGIFLTGTAVEYIAGDVTHGYAFGGGIVFALLIWLASKIGDTAERTKIDNRQDMERHFYDRFNDHGHNNKH